MENREIADLQDFAEILHRYKIEECDLQSLESIFKRMERRTRTGNLVFYIWFLVTTAAMIIAAYLGNAGVGMCIFLSTALPLAVSIHYSAEYRVVRRLHIWVILESYFRGMENGEK